jgi:hypothetical protein
VEFAAAQAFERLVGSLEWKDLDLGFNRNLGREFEQFLSVPAREIGN